MVPLGALRPARRVGAAFYELVAIPGGRLGAVLGLRTVGTTLFFFSCSPTRFDQSIAVYWLGSTLFSNIQHVAMSHPRVRLLMGLRMTPSLSKSVIHLAQERHRRGELVGDLITSLRLLRRPPWWPAST